MFLVRNFHVILNLIGYNYDIQSLLSFCANLHIYSFDIFNDIDTFNIVCYYSIIMLYIRIARLSSDTAVPLDQHNLILIYILICFILASSQGQPTQSMYCLLLLRVATQWVEMLIDSVSG